MADEMMSKNAREGKFAKQVTAMSRTEIGELIRFFADEMKITPSDRYRAECTVNTEILVAELDRRDQLGISR